MKTAIPLGTGVALLEWYQTKPSSRSNASVFLTLMEPSAWEEEGGGYAPAESVKLILRGPEVDRLVDALNNAIESQMQGDEE